MIALRASKVVISYVTEANVHRGKCRIIAVGSEISLYDCLSSSVIRNIFLPHYPKGCGYGWSSIITLNAPKLSFYGLLWCKYFLPQYLGKIRLDNPKVRFCRIGLVFRHLELNVTQNMIPGVLTNLKNSDKFRRGCISSDMCTVGPLMI